MCRCCAIVTAVDELATLYARPSEPVLTKEIDHVDAVGRAFLAASPFLILFGVETID